MLMTKEKLYETQKIGQVVLFDCRFKLADKDWGKNQYLLGHIEGAQYLHLEKDLSALVAEHGGRHPLPNIATFSKKLGDFGADEHTVIVVYDSGQGMATRAWWLIRFIGHKHVYVLDGGLNAWVKAGFPLTTAVPTPEPRTFLPNVQADWILGYSQVCDIAAGRKQGQLIDARAFKRYLGETEPIDKAAGHIPTAVNAPWQDGLDESGYWKTPELQRERFAQLNMSDKPVVVYCGSGVTACATLFAMELARIEGVKLYPGSWSDWVSYAQSPIERDPK